MGWPKIPAENPQPAIHGVVVEVAHYDNAHLRVHAPQRVGNLHAQFGGCHAVRLGLFLIVSGNLVNAPDNRWNFFEARVLNFDFLKDTEGNRQGYPRRTFSAGSFLGGYSDHFPTEIFLRATASRQSACTIRRLPRG